MVFPKSLAFIDFLSNAIDICFRMIYFSMIRVISIKIT